jgi:hypothetical protein
MYSQHNQQQKRPFPRQIILVPDYHQHWSKHVVMDFRTFKVNDY